MPSSFVGPFFQLRMAESDLRLLQTVLAEYLAADAFETPETTEQAREVHDCLRDALPEVSPASGPMNDLAA